MKTVDDILQLPNSEFDKGTAWYALDEIIEGSTDSRTRTAQWMRVVSDVEARGRSSGHAHFRLGIAHLLGDPNETVGISHLQLAYEQDQAFAPTGRAHRMAAYRVLSLVRFLAALRGRDNWQSKQLEPRHRPVLIGTLLALYDATARRNILDMPVHTNVPFFSLIGDDGLRVFAGENYRCAQDLLEWAETTSGNSFLSTNEYPLARAVVGLYGGVLEAILADKLSTTGKKRSGNSYTTHTARVPC